MVKGKLERMLNDFAEKKETFFWPLKKKNFLKSKNRTFPKGLTHAFGQIMPIFSLFKFDQNKPRNGA